ncbi:hypothetical protein [Kribbella sp. VKM Ac-2568]|uniref:hypothetical protein n=1 Tax=Kribbella sp. VKM Ac-2568 TaxID=2512219 RepID=UPI001042E919|nr:hypothetical protein [Kribbella sp. VKM Ac-2568]TCM49033.1 hypothetical protein EV648_103301 [Kribbella sp. VKM Ac-2568]
MIPAAFASTIIEREGSVGRSWIAALPGLVERYLSLWSCMVEGPWTHGQVDLIVPVDRGLSVLMTPRP